MHKPRISSRKAGYGSKILHSFTLMPDQTFRPFISIVIPVFNVEQFVERCLDSIFLQNFSHSFEVIAVDDASTDNSLQILRDYQHKETRLIVIAHDINKNLSIARSTGMKIAKGSYIMHVDSDDWILPGSLAQIHERLSEHTVDVLVFNYQRQDSLGNTTVLKNIDAKVLTTDKKAIVKHFLGACWNKIIKKELADDLVYGNAAINSQEDLVYSFEVLMKARVILLTPDILYVYFDNLASITRVIQPTAYLNLQVNILTEIKKIFQKYFTEHNLQVQVYGYMMKFVYSMLARLHFIKKGIVPDLLDSLMLEIDDKALLDPEHISTLRSAIHNKWFCLWQVKKYSGIKVAASITWHGLSRRFK